jgi:hypothetical protein
VSLSLPRPPHVGLPTRSWKARPWRSRGPACSRRSSTARCTNTTLTGSGAARPPASPSPSSTPPPARCSTGCKVRALLPLPLPFPRLVLSFVQWGRGLIGMRRAPLNFFDVRHVKSWLISAINGRVRAQSLPSILLTASDSGP